MGNLGGMEVIVVLLVALIVLGPSRLPEAARQVGKAVTEVRRISGGFQRELREAMQDPIVEAEARSKGAKVQKPTDGSGEEKPDPSGDDPTGGPVPRSDHPDESSPTTE